MPPGTTVLLGIPLALAEHLQSRAVEHQVDGSAVPDDPRLATAEAAGMPGQGGVVGHEQLEPEQPQHGAGKCLGLAHGEMKDETQGQHQLDRRCRPRGILLDVAIAVEAIAPVCIVTGRLARPAAGVLTAFAPRPPCCITRFWTHDDLLARGTSTGREEFWEFLQNFGLVGGLLLVVLGRELDSVAEVVHHPLAPPAGIRTPSRGR